MFKFTYTEFLLNPHYSLGERTGTVETITFSRSAKKAMAGEGARAKKQEGNIDACSVMAQWTLEKDGKVIKKGWD